MMIATDEQKNQMRQRLKDISAKKFMTTMIFSLAEFEKMFGDLWGHGLPINELDEEQLESRKDWEECRQRILDNGNKQKRNFNAELDMHEVIWNRYNYTLVPIEKVTKMNRKDNVGEEIAEEIDGNVNVNISYSNDKVKTGANGNG